MLCSVMERGEEDLQDKELLAQPGSTSLGTPEVCPINIWGQILQKSHITCVSCAHLWVTELHIHPLLPFPRADSFSHPFPSSTIPLQQGAVA